MLSNEFINDAFNKLLREAVGADIGIAWKNKKFVPKPDQVWLKAINAPSSTYSVTLGDNGHNELPGFYQVTIYSPLNTGTVKQNQILDSVRKKFKLGSRIPCPDDHTIRIVSLDFSQGGQTSLNDFTKGGVDDNWDVNFITIYWSAREPR
ncbi:hypothetical protein OMDBNIEC_00082 [Salmonella phage STP-SP5]|nr:hypothetical protein OMDBNIEC_00082 [Salmonella phage STP-SP5]